MSGLEADRPQMRPSIQLASGKFFNFRSHSVKDIDIEDIASSLAKLCRFTGQCNDLYNVAQHSVLVSTLVPHELALAGLLHDATEAYLGDMSSPVKQLIPAFRELEARIWPVIAARFDLPDPLPPCVKAADNVALVTERRDFMPEPVDYVDEWAWAKGIEPLPYKLVAMDWRSSRNLFLKRYWSLTKGK